MDRSLIHQMLKQTSSIYPLWLILLGVALFLLDGCSQNSICLEPQALALHGGFYYKDTANKNKDTLLVNANIRFGTNYAYFTNLKKISKFSLPLSPSLDTIPIIFQSDSTSSDPNTVDTFQLIYTRNLHFISAACGYQTEFVLQKTITTQHVIDSVLISTAKINASYNEHLKILVK